MARNQSNHARVEFHKHPPERRRGIGASGYCCCGSCCCCCCLHSLGGLVGAAAGSRCKGAPLSGRGMRSYWGVLASLTVVAISLPVLAQWRQYVGALGDFLKGTGGSLPVVRAQSMEIGIMIALLLMPGIQLVCSLIMAIWVEVRRGYSAEEKSASRRTIGRITIWSFLGAVVGLVVMVILFQATKHG